MSEGVRVCGGVREGGQGGQTVIGDGINVYMTNQNVDYAF